MKDHIIICGAGATGRYIITELFHARMPVLAIDTDEHVLELIRQHHPGAVYEYIVGDATDDEVLDRAGLPDARGVAATLPSDKDNLYIVVATRQSGSKARIVARVTEPSHAERLERVGADTVIAANYIGGRRMATEMLRPSLIRFLDDMLKDPRAYRLSEVTVEEGSSLAGKTFVEAAIRERFGVSVLALGPPSGGWRYNPADDEQLVAGTVVIVLGSTDQVEPLQVAGRSPK